MSVAFFAVPTRTMEDTVLSGDWLFVRRHGARGPGRGDVIVFRYPVDPNETFLQRVVGLPGDRIRIASKQLHVNGRKLDEPYATHKSIHLDSYRDNFPDDPNVPLAPQGAEMLSEHVSNGEVKVPPNRYFVLGDNRDSSWDSRYWALCRVKTSSGNPGSCTGQLSPRSHLLVNQAWAGLLSPESVGDAFLHLSATIPFDERRR